MKGLAMLICVLLLSGCATIVASGPTDMTFRSDPEGADVSVNGESKGTAPVTVPLHAEDDNLVQFYKAGCRDLALVPETSVGAGYVIADIFLPFGLIVDLVTQEWQGFKENDITGHLDCGIASADS